MPLKTYLENFKSSPRITLIGPLFDNTGITEEPVIFVDGGARFRKAREGISVGDGDSYQGKLDILLNQDKDYSDLAFVLRYIPETICDVNLAGFLGGRRDHELFNIGEAHHFLRSRKSATKISFDNAITGYSSGKWQFDHTGRFSVSVIEETHISIDGACRYTQARKTRFTPLSSLGLSNEGNGTIYVECDGPVFVLFETTR